MYAIAILRYRRALDEVQVHQDAHRAYIRDLQERDIVMAGGPLVPRHGGAILFNVPDEGAQQTLDAIRDNDPYVTAGVAQWEIMLWTPVIGGLE